MLDGMPWAAMSHETNHTECEMESNELIWNRTLCDAMPGKEMEANAAQSIEIKSEKKGIKYNRASSHEIKQNSTLLYCTLLYCTLLYPTLLYSLYSVLYTLRYFTSHSKTDESFVAIQAAAFALSKRSRRKFLPLACQLLYIKQCQMKIHRSTAADKTPLVHTVDSISRDSLLIAISPLIHLASCEVTIPRICQCKRS